MCHMVCRSSDRNQCRGPDSSGTSAMGPHVNKKTGTKYCSVSFSGLGHCPMIAFINKGFAKLVRTIPPVFPSSWLVEALPQRKSKGCLVFLSSLNLRIGALTVSLAGQTQANSLLWQIVLIARLSRSSFLYPVTRFLH